MSRAFRLLMAALLLHALPQPAAAQVHRCLAADGSRLYTDHPCAELGARAADRPPTSSGATDRPETVCARSLTALMQALRDALAAGDVNRIASLYDWNGMGNRRANQVLDQLQQIAGATVLDLRLIRAAADPPQTNAPTLPSSLAASGLRVTLLRASSTSAVSLQFGVRARLGCWWLQP